MKKYTIQDCKRIALEKNGECLAIAYINVLTKMPWRCNEGHTWSVGFMAILIGQWCPHCAGVARLTLQDCIDFATKKGGKCKSQAYINNRTHMEWECEYGHTWQAKFNSIKNGHWCPTCSPTARITIEQCKELIESKGGKCISTSMKNTKTKVLVECEKKHQWETRYNDIHSGYWCPYCATTISKPQQELYNWLKDTFPLLKITLNDKETIEPKHLDIYISELKLGIEYDGERWHHSEWAIKKGQKAKDRDKNRICKVKGIKLIRIRERNWKADKEKCLTQVAALINSLVR